MGNTYGMYDMGGNSYNRGMDGNSYMYYDPRYDSPMYSMARGGRGYARTSSKEEMIEEMKQLMVETNDEKVRTAISEAITKMNK